MISELEPEVSLPDLLVHVAETHCKSATSRLKRSGSLQCGCTALAGVNLYLCPG
jgi:hypothetical protein